MKHTQHGRVFFVLIALVTLTITAAVCMILYRSSGVEQGREQACETLQIAARQQSRMLNTMVDARFGEMTAFSDALAVSGELDIPDALSRLRLSFEATENFSAAVVSSNGSAYYCDGTVASVADRDYFARAMSGENVVEKVDSGRVSSQLRVVFAVPVYSGTAIRGVFLCSYSQASLADELFDELYEQSAAFLCDSQGNILFGGPETEDWFSDGNLLTALGMQKDGTTSSAALSESVPTDSGRSSDAEEDASRGLLSDLQAGNSGVLDCTLGGKEWIAAYEPAGINDWYIFSLADSEKVTSLSNQLTRDGLVLTVGILMVALALSLVIFFQNQSHTKKLIAEQERLRASEERARLALTHSTVHIWDYDLKMHSIVEYSDNLNLTGFERVIAGVPESMIRSGYIHPESADAYRAIYKRLEAGDRVVEGVFKIRSASADGYGYEHVRYTNLFNDAGAPYKAIGMSEDVTSKQEARQRYRREQERREKQKDTLLSSACYNISKHLLVDAQCSDALEKCGAWDETLETYTALLLGKAPEQPELLELLKPERLRTRVDRGQNSFSCEYRRTQQNESVRWVSLEVSLLREPESGDLLAFLYLRDVDSKKQELEQLRSRSEQDSLTGLLNHDAAFVQMTEYLRAEPDKLNALYMIDIDNFKAVNDTFGHDAGDENLRAAAASIRGLFRGTDLIGRIGGDEFLVFLKDSPSPRLIRQKARELCDALQYVYSGDTGSMQLSASVGVAVYNHDGKTFDALRGEADSAMYRSKREGKNRFTIFDPSFEEVAEELPRPGNRTETIRPGELLERINGGILLCELVHELPRLLYASPSCSAALGIPEIHSGDGLQNVFDRVVSEDRAGLYAALKNSLFGKVPAEVVYRVNQSGELRWHQIHANSMLFGGRLVLCAVVTDVHSIMRRQEQTLINNEVGRAALALTGASLWEVSISARTLTLSSTNGHSYTFPADAKVVCEAGAVYPESEQALAWLFANVFAGRESEDCLLHVAQSIAGTNSSVPNASSGNGCWARVRYTLLHDENDGLTGAAGIVEPVQDISAETEAYDRERGLSAEAEQTGFSVFRMNLTQDKVEYTALSAVLSPEYPGDAPFPSYTEWLRECSAHVEFADERRQCQEKLNAESLRLAYKNGKRQLSVSFRRRAASGQTLWYALRVRLCRDPIGRDLIGFVALQENDLLLRAERLLPFRAELDADTDLYTLRTFEAVLLSLRRGDSGVGSLAVLLADSSEDVPVLASCLYTLLPSGAFAGRTAANELSIFFPKVPPEEALRATKRLCETLTRLNAGGGKAAPRVYGGVASDVSLRFEPLHVRARGAAEIVRQQTHLVALPEEAQDGTSLSEKTQEAEQTPNPAFERDPLTGAYSRENFRRTMERMTESSAASGMALGVVCVSLAGIRRLNHEQGVEYTDSMLRAIADTLGRWFPAEQIFRLGSGEFVALGVNMSKERASAVLDGLHRAFRAACPGLVGIGSEWEADTRDPKELVRQAQERMLSHRASLPADLPPAPYRNRLERWLHQGIEQGRFQLHLQARLALADRKVVGCEALVRYVDAKYGILMPDNFLPVLERERLISQLDLHVFAQAAELLRCWRADGLTLIPISVNFSRQTILLPEITQALEKAVPDASLRSYLSIETAENPEEETREAYEAAFIRLREAGYSLTLDDLGGRQSGMMDLTGRHYDTGKLGREVVSSLGGSKAGLLAADSIARLCAEVGSEPDAVGVETEGQVELLKNAGYTAAQGYLFGKPLPAAEFRSTFLK